MNQFARNLSPLIPATLDSLSVTPPVAHFDVGLVGDVYLRDDFLAKFGFLRPRNLLQMIRQHN